MHEGPVLVASSRVAHDADRYLKAARPPMLTDYFNPDLHIVLPIHRRLRQVTARVEVEEDLVPA